MRRTLSLTALLVCLLSLSVLIFFRRDEGPAHAVQEYCARAALGDYDGVKFYTTRVPEAYWEYKAKQVEEHRGARKAPEVEPMTSSGGAISPILSGKFSGTVFLSTLNESLPTILHDRSDVLKNVDRVFVKGNEAKVWARVGPKEAERGTMSYEFLLYRTDEGWKIFLIQLPSLTEPYAMPEKSGE